MKSEAGKYSTVVSEDSCERSNVGSSSKEEILLITFT